MIQRNALAQSLSIDTNVAKCVNNPKVTDQSHPSTPVSNPASEPALEIPELGTRHPKLFLSGRGGADSGGFHIGKRDRQRQTSSPSDVDGRWIETNKCRLKRME
ncbi:hypothetical protein Cob_v011423 [Colletotrichum orbiculare MAFF 240422]|uniref:Uncharacterized protein n=1 Tax=Colletotrichum orbiculare (strain 104-T / ATCC 96160 / CBS 514.97 / LARS 414 / MAFF 240422) TaxID=1213857 RepID=A0A484FDP0_COLOR|nr:hypothetical protein Cob_v011423 [Colletotrichum orbiculare MAFF 240422]